MKAQLHAAGVRNKVMVAAVAVAMLTLGATVAPAHAAPVEIDNPPPAGQSNQFCSFDDPPVPSVGQWFISTVTGTLNEVGVYVDSPGAEATLVIKEGIGNDGTQLGETLNVTIPEADSEFPISFLLPTPIEVTEGGTYSFELTPEIGCPLQFNYGGDTGEGDLLIGGISQPDSRDLAFRLQFDSAQQGTSPSLNGTPTAGTVGQPYSFQFTVGGDPAPRVTAAGLPAWLSISPSGLLTGTPTEAGSWTFRVSASNSSGFVAISTTVTVNEAVKPKADLKLSMSSPATVQRNATFSYTVTVRNDGPSTATGVKTTVALPPGVKYVSASPAVTVTGGVVWWNGPDLATGQSATLAIKVKAVDKGKQIAAGATWSAVRDDRPLNNIAAAVTQVK